METLIYYTASEMTLPVLNIIGATTSIFLALILSDNSDRHSLSQSGSGEHMIGIYAGTSGDIPTKYTTFESNCSASPGFKKKNSKDCTTSLALVEIDRLTTQITENLQQLEIQEAISDWEELEFRVNSTENEDDLNLLTVYQPFSPFSSREILEMQFSKILNSILRPPDALQFSSISSFVEKINSHLRIRAYNLSLGHFLENAGNKLSDSDSGDTNPTTSVSSTSTSMSSKPTILPSSTAAILDFAQFLRDDYEWLRSTKTMTKTNRALFYSVVRRFPHLVKTMIFTTRVVISSSKISSPTNNNGYLYASGNKALFSPSLSGAGAGQHPVFLWTQPTSENRIAKEGKWQLIYNGNGTFSIFNPFWRENLCSTGTVTGTGSANNVDSNFVFTEPESPDNTNQCYWKIDRHFGDINVTQSSTPGKSGNGNLRIFTEIGHERNILQFEKYEGKTPVGKTRNYRSNVYTKKMETTFFEENGSVATDTSNGNDNAGWNILPLVYII